MKQLVLSFFISCALPVFAQQSFTTILQLPKAVDTGKLEVYYHDGTKEVVVRPLAFQQGKLIVSGQFQGRYAVLWLQYRRSEWTFHERRYFINPGSSSITYPAAAVPTFDQSPFDSSIVYNATDIYRSVSYLKERAYCQKEWQAVKTANTQYGLAKNEEERRALIPAILESEKALQHQQASFIKENPDDYYTLYLLKDLLRYDDGIDNASSLFNGLSTALKNSFEGQEIQKQLYGIAYAKKGYQAPLFTTTDNTGKKISLEALKGKFVLLQFWSTSCGPCIAEMPMIKRIRDTYAADKLEVISLSSDRHYEAFAAALKKHQMNWSSVFGAHDVFGYYAVSGIPAVYLIDPTGKIIWNRDEAPDERSLEITLAAGIQ